MAEKITIQKKLSQTKFRRRYEALVHSVGQDTLALEPGDEGRGERLRRAKTDHFYFFRTYLPHYFTDKEAEFHHELLAMLDQRPSKEAPLVPVAVAAPREFAKSTITSFGYALHQLLFKLRNFIIIGSDTEDLASDLTSYILVELCRNRRIIRDFGKLGRETWASNDFVTTNDVRILARGRGQRVRGLKHRQHRPDLVILDDLENDLNVRNPRLVRSLLKWIVEAVYPGIAPDGSLFLIGTILARRSALNIIARGEEEPFNQWKRKIYRAVQSDGSSLWPERHPVSKLMEQKRMMGSIAFNKEKQNNPLDEDAPFREEWIRYYHPSEIAGKALTVVGFLDPSSKETGDDKALVTVGLDREAMIYYVLDAWMRKASPALMIDAAYQQYGLHRWLRLGVEDNALKDFLRAVLDSAARGKGYHLPIKTIHHATNKEARIVAGLSHLVEHGALLFRKDQGDQKGLVEQLLFLDQPSVPDDGADALEGAISLLRDAGAGFEYAGSGRKRAVNGMSNY